MLILYRIYFLLIAAPLLLVLTALTAITNIVASLLNGGRWWMYVPAHIWSRLFCWLTLVRVRVRGRQNIQSGKSYVFVANHQGAYDIFTIYGFLNHNFKWMMKRELQRIPLVGYSCKRAGMIFVDNSSASAVRRTMVDAERQLRKGMSVVVFPEGSRTLDGKMHAFRRGAYMLAVEFGLPVVPLTIDGSYDVLRRTALWPHWGTIILTIHPPIEAPDRGHDLRALMDQSREAIASALPAELR